MLVSKLTVLEDPFSASLWCSMSREVYSVKIHLAQYLRSSLVHRLLQLM